MIDDFSDDAKLLRYSKILHGVFTRCRHNAINVICSLQKCNSIANIIRVNASSLYIFRLKHIAELMSFLEENAAIVDKDKLLEMYHTAINHYPYSLFYLDLKDVNDLQLNNDPLQYLMGLYNA